MASPILVGVSPKRWSPVFTLLISCSVPQWFTPVSCHCLLGYEFQRVGQLRYKCMLNPERWQRAFFILQKSHLFICPAEEDGAEDSINLRRLQELSESQPCHSPGQASPGGSAWL